MKRFIITLLFLADALAGNAQAPDRFQYQTLVRNNLSAPIANQNVSFRINIHQTTAAGSVAYSETHNSTTNDFGLVNLELGGGVAVSGTFGSIDWESNLYSVEVELLALEGSSFSMMHTAQPRSTAKSKTMRPQAVRLPSILPKLQVTL